MPHKPSDLDTLPVLGLQSHRKQLGQEFSLPATEPIRIALSKYLTSLAYLIAILACKLVYRSDLPKSYL